MYVDLKLRYSPKIVKKTNGWEQKMTFSIDYYTRKRRNIEMTLKVNINIFQFQEHFYCNNITLRLRLRAQSRWRHSVFLARHKKQSIVKKNRSANIARGPMHNNFINFYQNITNNNFTIHNFNHVHSSTCMNNVILYMYIVRTYSRKAKLSNIVC